MSCFFTDLPGTGYSKTAYCVSGNCWSSSKKYLPPRQLAVEGCVSPPRPQTDLADRFPHHCGAAALSADLQAFSSPLDGIHQGAPLAQVVAAGFFDIHVFARIEREDCGGSVPVIGSGDEHGVNRLIIEHL